MATIKLTPEQVLHFENRKHKETIRLLVQLIDEVRQPLNNSERHHALYEKATNKLNQLEVEGRLP